MPQHSKAHVYVKSHYQATNVCIAASGSRLSQETDPLENDDADQCMDIQQNHSPPEIEQSVTGCVTSTRNSGREGGEILICSISHLICKGLALPEIVEARLCYKCCRSKHIQSPPDADYCNPSPQAFCRQEEESPSADSAQCGSQKQSGLC